MSLIFEKSGASGLTSYLGSRSEYTLETAAGELFAIVREVGALRPPGERVGIRVLDHGVYAVRGSDVAT